MAEQIESGAQGDLLGRRVLIVEDEFFIAADLTEALGELGAEIVGPVPTRGEAAALVEGASPGSPLPDLVVLDINLQGEMAHPFADLLTQRGIPFVFATGYAPSVVPERFRGVPRWEKPFDPAKLARALSPLMSSR